MDITRITAKVHINLLIGALLAGSLVTACSGEPAPAEASLDPTPTASESLAPTPTPTDAEEPAPAGESDNLTAGEVHTAAVEAMAAVTSYWFEAYVSVEGSPTPVADNRTEGAWAGGNYDFSSVYSLPDSMHEIRVIGIDGKWYSRLVGPGSVWTEIAAPDTQSLPRISTKVEVEPVDSVRFAPEPADPDTYELWGRRIASEGTVGEFTIESVFVISRSDFRVVEVKRSLKLADGRTIRQRYAYSGYNDNIVIEAPPL